MAQAAICLRNPTMAESLLADKISAVNKTKATLLATSNIGCALHIAAGLHTQNSRVKVLHPVTIIAKQLGYTELID